MIILNEKKLAFRDMTKEDRGEWKDVPVGYIADGYAYRTRPRQLVIPWRAIDKKYKWAAIDEDGTVWAYEFEPIILECRWSGGGGRKLDRFDIDTKDIQWQNSKTQRPENV
jgi:hypothetical protein